MAVQRGSSRAAGLLEILRRGDAVATVLGKEVRPRLELVVVDRLRVAGVEVLDAQPGSMVMMRTARTQIPTYIRDRLSRSARTAASVTRLSARRPCPPHISTTETRSSAVAVARCTKPGAAHLPWNVAGRADQVGLPQAALGHGGVVRPRASRSMPARCGRDLRASRHRQASARLLQHEGREHRQDLQADAVAELIDRLQQLGRLEARSATTAPRACRPARIPLPPVSAASE